MNPDPNQDLEQQFILRMMDPAAAESLAADIESGVPIKSNLTIEFKPEMRNNIVRYNGQVYQGQLMDLPCVIESMKTTDKRTFYKTADIFQMLVCTQGAEAGPLRGTAAYLDNRAGSRANNVVETGPDTRQFQFLHGITPPLKNVLRRRFRKCRKKRLVDMPQIEKEVKQLLRADLEAVEVKWQVVWSSPPHVQDGIGGESSTSLAEGNGTRAGVGGAGGRTYEEDEEDEEDEEGRRMYAIDRRDVFGDISSSSLSSGDSSGGSSNESGPETGASETGATDRRRQSLNRRRAGVPRGGGRSSLFLTASHDNSLPKAPEVDDTTRPPVCGATDDTSMNSVDYTSLKHELAAQLLLSDSDNEDEVERGAELLSGDLNQNDLHDEADLQASVAARLVEQDEEEEIGDEADDIDGAVGEEEDDDDGMPQGGELLDDATLATFNAVAAAAASEKSHHYLGLLSSDEEDDGGRL